MKLLQKRPDDRYPFAEALRADLNRYLDGDSLPPKGPPPAPCRRGCSRCGRSRRRRPPHRANRRSIPVSVQPIDDVDGG